MQTQEILFYGEISNFTVSSFMLRMQEAKKSESNVIIPANSMGGDPDAGFGLIVAIRNFPFRKKMSVHGTAYSSMAFALLYVDDSECIEQSQFLFHRAASIAEDDETMIKILEGRNSDLRKAMEERLDIGAFERITGVTLDQLFDMNQRIDVILDAQQALEVNLIKKVLPLSANEAADMNSRMMAASQGKGIKTIHVEEYNMKTLAELKEKDPQGYSNLMEVAKKEVSADPEKTAEVVASTDQTAVEAVQKERERVEEWNVYAEIDSKKVLEGISSGKAMTMAQKSEFLLQASKNSFSQRLEDGGSAVQTDEAGGQKSKETMDLQQIEASLRSSIGLSEAKKPLLSIKDASIAS